MISKLVCFIILAFMQNQANAKTVRYTFTISYISGSPDGVNTNSILGINGRFPGPIIEAEVGDILQVTVVNNIQDGQNVTIHWHGLHQKGTPFEDGPSQITQCPLKKGSTQVYTMPLPLAGTYWYHSHVNSQYTEGLWGSLIVRATPEVYDQFYDQEIVITLNDWYHTSAKQNEEYYLRKATGAIAPPFPFSVLMNGMGRYPCNYASAQMRLCVSGTQRRPVFRLPQGRTHRVRLINTSGWVAFNFTIDGHTLRPIEVDGVDTLIGSGIEGVHIGAGQRYSFLLTADQGAPGSSFLIRANVRREFLFVIPGENINPHPEVMIDEVTGVLRYITLEESQPATKLVAHSYEQFDYTQRYTVTKQWSAMSFLQETTLLPFDGIQAASSFDTQIRLDVAFLRDSEGINRGSFNGRPFHLTSHLPQLAKMVKGVPMPADTLPFYLGYNQVVQVIINNPQGGTHPMHLHGHHFWVVGMGQSREGNFDPYRHHLNFSGYRRDTVMIKDNSWLVIRFRADNIGLWTLHCHIDWHNLSGMAMTFVEAPELAHTLTIPLEARKVCADHGVVL